MNTNVEWEKRISYFASQLSDRFPDLELRFTVTFDRLTLNIDGSRLEFSLTDAQYDTLLNEATFGIKMLKGRFDA